MLKVVKRMLVTFELAAEFSEQFIVRYVGLVILNLTILELFYIFQQYLVDILLLFERFEDELTLLIDVGPDVIKIEVLSIWIRFGYDGLHGGEHFLVVATEYLIQRLDERPNSIATRIIELVLANGEQDADFCFFEQILVDEEDYYLNQFVARVLQSGNVDELTALTLNGMKTRIKCFRARVGMANFWTRRSSLDVDDLQMHLLYVVGSYLQYLLLNVLEA